MFSWAYGHFHQRFCVLIIRVTMEGVPTLPLPDAGWFPDFHCSAPSNGWCLFGASYRNIKPMAEMTFVESNPVSFSWQGYVVSIIDSPLQRRPVSVPIYKQKTLLRTTATEEMDSHATWMVFGGVESRRAIHESFDLWSNQRWIAA